jgi:predicted metal-dependent hydrolase
MHGAEVQEHRRRCLGAGARVVIAGRSGLTARAAMQFDFFQRLLNRARPAGPVSSVRVGELEVPVEFVRHPRARRYVLRLTPERVARVTVPRFGNREEALAFANRQVAWLEKQLAKPLRTTRASDWQAGTEIYFRGERVTLQLETHASGCVVKFASETVALREPASNLRPAVERHLWRLAAAELPVRLLELGSQHGIAVTRITVRNQRSRWGSCSRAGTISLNWRLIQTPDFVRDYICVHELMHRREMNHSARYWGQVAEAFPRWEEAERWLKENCGLLR